MAPHTYSIAPAARTSTHLHMDTDLRTLAWATHLASCGRHTCPACTASAPKTALSQTPVYRHYYMPSPRHPHNPVDTTFRKKGPHRFWGHSETLR